MFLTGSSTLSTPFDLFYWDGLANQGDEIRLTIHPGKYQDENVKNGLIPPLEHVIRTKWKTAIVDWNGTDPLL